MKINLKNMERGLQRLYYVLWLVLGVSLSALVLQQEFEYAKSGVETALTLAMVFGSAVIAPWLFMVATRWVYRGFLPKPD